MLIEIDTSRDTPEQFRALSTLLLTLAGSVSPAALAPPAPIAEQPSPPVAAQIEGAPLPPPPATPAEAADAIMAAESARVAPPVPGAATNIRNADGTPVLDAEGLPWDGRIHSSNQKMTAKGVWTQVRNLDAAKAAQVRAELLATMGAPAVPLAVAPPPPVAAPAVAPPPPVATGVEAPLPPVAAASGETAAAGAVDFPALMMRVANLQHAGTVAAEEVKGFCVALGLSQIRDFASRPEMIPSMMALLPAAA